MLFRYTENPPESPIFPPAALRVSAKAFSYTENSSFPYTLAHRSPLFPWCRFVSTLSTASVESGCGAVAVGSAYLFPPLSSGGASIAEPLLRFHTPLIEPDGRY